MQSTNGEYNLYRDCNLLCHKDCFTIRKNVPFDVLELCVEKRCNCRHDWIIENPPFFCDTSCRDECVEKKMYYWTGEPGLSDCVKMCGCMN